jgi:hypothetical protein
MIWFAEWRSAKTPPVILLYLKAENFFFCSQGCLAEFKRRPQDYLKPATDCCGRSPCVCGKPWCGESLEEEKRDV